MHNSILLLACIPADTRILSFLLSHQTYALVPTNLYGQTPLHTACEFVNLEAVEELLEHFTPLDPVDYLGRTPLMTAIYRNHIPIVKRLLDIVYPSASAVDINHQDDAGNTPFHACSFTDSLDIADLLYNCRANPFRAIIESNRATNERNTILPGV